MLWFGSPGGPGVEVSRFRFRYVEIAGVLCVLVLSKRGRAADRKICNEVI